MDIGSCNLRGCDVSSLPIMSAFINKIGVTGEVDRLCCAQRDVSLGYMVFALILDTLSGRSHLHRLERSIAEMYLELLVGEGVTASKLNDDEVGRFRPRS